MKNLIKDLTNEQILATVNSSNFDAIHLFKDIFYLKRSWNGLNKFYHGCDYNKSGGWFWLRPMNHPKSNMTETWLECSSCQVRIQSKKAENLAKVFSL